MVVCSLVLYLLLAALILLITYCRNYVKLVFLALKLPSPKAVPLLGHALYIKNNERLLWLGNNAHSFGPIISCWISLFPMFFVHEPNDLQVLLSTHRYSTKNLFYKFLHNFIGEGLITNTGDKWRDHRKLIQPYFHRNVLKIYFEAFQKGARFFVKNLATDRPLNIIPFANKFVLDVLHETVLGIPIEKQTPDSPFRSGKVFLADRIVRPWLLLQKIFKLTNSFQLELTQKHLLQQYTRNLLDKKRTRGPSSPPKNLLEMLIEIARNEPKFTDEDIINEACTFMLAGQDSVGAALAFTLFYLAENQDIQTKACAELDAIFKGFPRDLTYEDLGEMRYLEQCIKETLRLCPTVPLFSRKTLQGVTLGNEHFSAGTNILISPFFTQRSPKIYENPLKFDPERFSPENREKIHPYAYIPFSAGPRKCIGYKFALLEMKTALSEILRNYRISLIPGKDTLNLIYRVTLKTQGGIWIKLDPKNIPNCPHLD